MDKDMIGCKNKNESTFEIILIREYKNFIRIDMKGKLREQEKEYCMKIHTNKKAMFIDKSVDRCIYTFDLGLTKIEQRIMDSIDKNPDIESTNNSFRKKKMISKHIRLFFSSALKIVGYPASDIVRFFKQKNGILDLEPVLISYIIKCE